MRLRHLRIRIQTSNGLYGTDIPFPDGMVVIWADNSMGKSTCVKSVMVALGLEAILTTSMSDLPLTPVMKSFLEDETGKTHHVTESRIFLEIENADGERITIERLVRGDRDHNLVSVIQGPALTTPGKFPIDDYFLARSGAASRERGFHHFLATFLKWKLPSVQTYDGRDCPLYLQCVFPFLLVEQSRGWSTLQPPVPGQFRIKDPWLMKVRWWRP